MPLARPVTKVEIAMISVLDGGLTNGGFMLAMKFDVMFSKREITADI